MNNVPRIGSMIWKGNYSVEKDTSFRYGKRLKCFDYNWQRPEKERIVVFSDMSIPNAVNPRFSKVPHKVAWMMEGPGIYSSWGHFMGVKRWLFSHLHLFTAVATCDDTLVEEYPNKMIFVPLGGILVSPERSRIYAKTKLCSMISGVLYPPRDTVYNRYKLSGKIDFLGRALNRPYVFPADAYKDYMYHVSIPSSRANRYFTSNIVDAFACGTVPIWWGCSKIGDFFDTNGIIIINSINDLDGALEKIGEEDYDSRSEAVATNHRLVEKYRTPDNNLWENVLSQI